MYEQPASSHSSNEIRTVADNTIYYQDSQGKQVSRARTDTTLDNNRETTQQSSNAVTKSSSQSTSSSSSKSNANKAAQTGQSTSEATPDQVVQNATNGTDGSQVTDGQYSYENGSTVLFKLGRIHRYSSDVDPSGRIINYMRSKMTVIDLIPCTYTLSINKADTAEGVSGFLPKVEYATPQKEFKAQCKSYGLNDSYAGLRVFTTDDTISAESISHTRTTNVFEDTVNQAFTGFEQIRQMVESVDAKLLKNLGDKYATPMINKMESGFNQMMSNPELAQTAGNLARFAVDKVLTGRRVAFPSIWSASDYQPNLSANIRLCSPYGHPNAIKEFLIQPLMYLLLLASPRTKDGVSFGRPYTMTIHAYGMAYNPIGYIRNISLRRGGSDTSFNLYKQPLTIDVTLDFDYLVHGFAAFEGDANMKESQLYSDAAKFLDEADVQGGERVCLPTINHIIKSLRPLSNNFGDSTTTAQNNEDSKKSELEAETQNAQASADSAKESTNNIVSETNEIPNTRTDQIYGAYDATNFGLV